MANRSADFAEIIESRYPGLVARVRTLVEQSEAAFEGTSGSGESFLWEHTTHVAALAGRLAREEKTDPVLPTIAALFHDAGKFPDGRYHGVERTEEEDAARVARPILRRAGLKDRDGQRVAAALRALYHQRSRPNRIADIVHDADFLAKFGTLGAAQFFVKSTLRGRTLRSALMNSLSKELTYAACLPQNMRTSAGERLARAKSRASLGFFRALLRELAEAGSGEYAVRTFTVRPDTPPRRPVKIRLAVPPACPDCGGRWTFGFRTDPGLKCEKLEAEIACGRCGESSSIAFCLPEIRQRRRT